MSSCRIFAYSFGSHVFTTPKISHSNRVVKFGHHLRLMMVVLVAMLLTGCYEIDVRIKVNIDGTGLVTETLKMNKDVIKVNGKPLEKSTPMSATEINERIKAYGGQVRLVSNEGILTEKSFGYKVVFEFDDVNKFRFSMKQWPRKDLSYNFKLTQGDSSILQITSNIDLFADAEKGLTAEEKKLKKLREELTNDPKFKELMKKNAEQLADARLSICVELGGKVLKSNAMYSQGSVIDLFSVDFNQIKLSQDFEKLMTMQNSGKLTKDEYMKMRLPGVRVELQKEITVEYQ